jgi:hypothetical protein
MRKRKYAQQFKLIRTKAPVALLDGVPNRNGNAYARDCKISFPDYPLPVQFENQMHDIGSAMLSRDGQTVCMDALLKPSVRLKGKLYPFITVSVHEEREQNGIRYVTECTPLCLGLSPDGNADPRIPPIQFQEE